MLSLKSAHVGHIQSENDSHILMQQISWLMHNGYAEYMDAARDLIDLRDGRDFLTELKEYDCVVLHWIFDPPGFCEAKTLVNHVARGKSARSKSRIQKLLATSPIHGWGVWHERLIQTGAKLIFAFGKDREISGRYLGNITGYQKTDVSESMTVYVRAN